MKKFISFIMAIGISLGCMNFVYAQETGIDVSSIENKFAAMDISLGDMFNGDTISRGDFARLMIEYLNLTLDNAEEYTRFIDVDTSHKAIGAVNRLYDLGYISGYGEYKFYPDRNITYAEALSIMVNAFGYKHLVQNSDNWLGSISKVVSDLSITDGVAFDITDSAKKPQLLKILDNALETEVMTVSFGNTTDTTLVIEQFHKIHIEQGVVTGNKFTSLASRNEGINDNILYINNKEIVFRNDYSDYLGYHAKCYYKDDNDEFEGLYIEKTKRNNSLELDGEEVEGFDSKYLSYTDETGKSRRYALDNIKIISNGVAYTEYGQPESIVFTNAVVKLLDNDNDASYEVMFITEYQSYFVSSVDTVNETITDNENSRQLNLNSTTYDVIIYNENSEPITINEIEKNTVVSVMESKNASGTVLKTVYVVDDVVSGKVTAVSQDNEYRVSDKYYKKASTCVQNILVGQQVTFYLGKDGRIVARTAENLGGIFAILYKIYEDEDNEDRVHLKLYTQNGEFEDYYVENKVMIDNSSANAKKAVLESLMSEGQVLIFENNGEKIKKIKLPKPESADRGEFRLLASGTNNLSVRGNNGANVLAGKVATEKGKTSVILAPSDPSERDAYGLFDFAMIENMRNKTYKIYTTSNEKLNFGDFVVLYDAAVAIINDDSDIYVVEKNSEGLTADNIPAKILTLSSAKNGLSSEFIVSDFLDMSLTAGYANAPISKIQGVDISEIDCGDTVAVATNALGEITRIEKVYDYDDPNNARARFRVDNNLVDTCHYYPEKYVDMGRLIFSTIDDTTANFIQFNTTVYQSQGDWINNENVGWQKEISTMNTNTIIVYNGKTKTTKKITRNELGNYIGKKAVIRINQCLMQEVIIYE